MTEQRTERTGQIIEALPGGLFRVQFPDGSIVTAHVAAASRMTTIRVLPGDAVAIAVSPFDLSRGTITRRGTVAE
ncbi:MAG: translation initiation factor IF-1 [Chloroflexota bacterium]|nr:MAG: translation initiation factor IF-1 [Chloroflexota bacterium]